MKHPFVSVVALLWSLCIDDTLAASPWSMTWSSKQFGPDGPWNAVDVSIGSDDTEIALYPGGTWQSWILLSTLCGNTTLSSTCYGDEAGLFNTDDSSTYDGTSISLDPDGSWSNIQYGVTNAVPIWAKAHRALDSMDIGGTGVSDVDLASISQGYQIYPGGKNYPLQVGILSLGSNNINQSFTTDPYPINGTFVTSWLYENGMIPSYSYGMHIGSASLGIPGSLKLGGYDQNRVIGEVSSQPISGGSSFPIELVDISIGVANGGSPWNSSNITGLLARDNSTLNSGLKLELDPTNPYIYLPQSSCDAIAAKLPVTYNSDLGLYFWDTTSSRYSKIVTSPSYLAFTFLKNGVNTEDITIKVPFALLNLTLEAPLVKSSTQYFPCMGTDSDPALGRAFLQAAFVGVNWPEGAWFLAQAPGPDDSFIEDVVSISESATTISGSGNSWEGTWEGSWTVLSTTNLSTNSSTDSSNMTTSDSSTGLSTGGKAGIGAGCGVAGLVIIAAACWFFIRHRRQKYDPAASQDSVTQVPSQQPRPVQLVPVEIPENKPNTLHELDYDQARKFQPPSTQNSEYGQSFQVSSKYEQSSQFSSDHPQGFQNGPYELSSRSSGI